MAQGALPIGAEAYARTLGREAAERYLAGKGATRCPWDPNVGSVTQQRLARAWTEAHRETMGPVDDTPLPD